MKAIESIESAINEIQNKANKAMDLAIKLEEAIKLERICLDAEKFTFSVYLGKLHANINISSFSNFIYELDFLERHLGIEFTSSHDYPHAGFRSYESEYLLINAFMTSDSPDKCIRVLSHVETVDRKVYKFICA